MSPQTAKELRSRRRYAANMEKARVEAAWLRFLLYLKGDQIIRKPKMAARKKRRYGWTFKRKEKSCRPSS